MERALQANPFYVADLLGLLVGGAAGLLLSASVTGSRFDPGARVMTGIAFPNPHHLAAGCSGRSICSGLSSRSTDTLYACLDF